jgi:chromosome segregation ATPase
MNPRSPRALIQMLDRAGAKDSGESHRQTGTEALVGRKARLSTKRNGAPDLVETRDPRDHGQNPKAIMKTSEKEIKGGRPPLIPAQAKVCKTFRNPERVKQQSKQSRTRVVRARREMASSSKGKLSTEERLKEMDKALANLQQLLQHQLDFLENLDVEAGRRLEQLESDITMTKIGFAEELDKLHKELKNPQQEFDERMEQLEAKMAQLNSNWSQEEKK